MNCSNFPDRVNERRKGALARFAIISQKDFAKKGGLVVSFDLKNDVRANTEIATDIDIEADYQKYVEKRIAEKAILMESISNYSLRDVRSKKMRTSKIKQ